MATRITGMIFAHEQECYTVKPYTERQLNGSATVERFS
jgi:hypothetical protein